MTSQRELQAPPEIFYNDEEARKYTSSSRIIDIQAQLSERAAELLALPDDGVPRLLLDIGNPDIALEREVEGDLLLGDMGLVGLLSLKLTPILLGLGSFALVLTMMGRYWYFQARWENAFSSD